MLTERAERALEQVVSRAHFANDVTYHFQTKYVREMLQRVELILMHEGLERDLVDRVLEGLVFGLAPSVADSVLRMNYEQELIELRQYATNPLVFKF